MEATRKIEKNLNEPSVDRTVILYLDPQVHTGG